MRLAYIEDEKAQRDYVLDLIDRWAALSHAHIESSSFESAEEFLFKYEPEGKGTFPFDLILVDIAMKEMNGLQLARRIRQYDKNVQLAFLTADKEFAVEGYEVGAVRYLIKPLQTEKLYELLSEEYRKNTLACPKDDTTLVLDTAGGMERIRLSEIHYIEAVGHYTHIYCTEGRIEVKANFSSICHKVKETASKASDDCFIQSHRSYLVNMRYVHRITREELQLDKGMGIPISRSAYKEVNEAFLNMYRKDIK